MSTFVTPLSHPVTAGISLLSNLLNSQLIHKWHEFCFCYFMGDRCNEKNSIRNNQSPKEKHNVIKSNCITPTRNFDKTLYINSESRQPDGLLRTV